MTDVTYLPDDDRHVEVAVAAAPPITFAQIDSLRPILTRLTPAQSDTTIQPVVGAPERRAA